MLSEAQTLQVLGRSARLFEQDFEDSHNAISDALCGSSILILGLCRVNRWCDGGENRRL